MCTKNSDLIYTQNDVSFWQSEKDSLKGVKIHIHMQVQPICGICTHSMKHIAVSVAKIVVDVI